MKCALLIIGDELLSGRIQDKNTFWLARFLSQNGHQLAHVQVISDEEKSIITALQKLTLEYPFVFTSGGLGPTGDDLTKPSLAKFCETKIVPNPKAYALLKSHYKRFQKDFEELKKRGNQYDLIPEGVEPIENPVGLAPGLYYKTKSSAILCAPGVPSEFIGMIKNSLESLLGKRERETTQITCRTKGIPEEKIFFELCPSLWEDLSKLGKVSSYPQIGGIDIVVTYEDDREKEIQNILEESALAPYIWQFGDLSVEELIIKIAKEKKKTIAVAESCTGGQIASRLTNISGSSEVFLGGVVSYSNECKMKVLQVQKETLDQYGAVSDPTASQMAKGVKELLNADLSISTTGIAGPTGGTPEKPVGTISIGQSYQNTESKTYQFHGDRARLKNYFTQVALWSLLDILQSANN